MGRSPHAIAQETWAFASWPIAWHLVQRHVRRRAAACDEPSRAPVRDVHRPTWHERVGGWAEQSMRLETTSPRPVRVSDQGRCVRPRQFGGCMRGVPAGHTRSRPVACASPPQKARRAVPVRPAPPARRLGSSLRGEPPLPRIGARHASITRESISPLCGPHGRPHGRRHQTTAIPPGSRDAPSPGNLGPPPPSASAETSEQEAMPRAGHGPDCEQIHEPRSAAGRYGLDSKSICECLLGCRTDRPAW